MSVSWSYTITYSDGSTFNVVHAPSFTGYVDGLTFTAPDRWAWSTPPVTA